MEPKKNIVGKCPICGADVVKTLKGYACVESFESEPKCSFFLFSTVGNRRLSDSEASLFLTYKRILLDGFGTKDGKCFSSVLTFNDDGTVGMSSQIGVCPRCGGDLFVNSRSVSCGNFKDKAKPCNFTVWRNIGGHELSLNEIDEIVSLGATVEPVTLYDAKGDVSLKRIGLNDHKEVVRL